MERVGRVQGQDLLRELGVKGFLSGPLEEGDDRVPLRGMVQTGLRRNLNIPDIRPALGKEGRDSGRDPFGQSSVDVELDAKFDRRIGRHFGWGDRN